MNQAQRIEHLMRQDKGSLQGQGESLHFNKGQVLYYQEHNLSGIYWIRSGEIALIHVENGKEHSENKGPENILGVEEFINWEPSKFTAQALGLCEVCYIPKTTFQDWLDQY